MENVDLLELVQPADGWFAVLGIKGPRDVRQKLVATREEVDQYADLYMSQKRNVFFGVARYETAANRTKENVKSLKAFWLDIDCGEAKAEINPETGRPDGYINQAAGLQALKAFCDKIGLPRPLLVNSGRGLHVYWPLTRAVTREEWEPVAERLCELCITHDFYVDPSAFEAARILRIPGTFNFKDDPPKPVTIISLADPVEYEELRAILGVKEKQELVIPERKMSLLGQKLQDDSISSFAKIMTRSAKKDGCQQLLSCYLERATLSEVRWFDALSVAKFCHDRDEAIQRMSEGHPDYDPMAALEKTKHIQGPHNCATFERNNPGGCQGCPHLGKIKNPIVLGKEVLEAAVEDDIYAEPTEDGVDEFKERYRIPVYPEPFFRGKTGGIYKRPKKEEEPPIFVYHNDLYVAKMMTDPKDGDVAVMRLHLPREEVREFVVPQSKATGDAAELRKLLASKGVACHRKSFEHLCEYVIAAINDLQDKRKMELMRLQFGWADNDSKFIVGDREITKDGIFHSPPSSITAQLAEHLVPSGTFEKWQEVFSLYGREGLEPHAFATLAAFGAPLFKFTGQSGAIINVIHPMSGTGKTTILHMCNSVWGHPKHLCSVKEDTFNAKLMQLGIMNNLPFTIDEMTNSTDKELSALSYSMSQGRAKNRMKASGNELRLNTTTWQTISVSSANVAFYEKLQLNKNRPDGEMMRLMEYKIDYTSSIPTDFAKEMFDHQLLENYGHAGIIYAQWLVNNLEEAKAGVKSIQAKIDAEIKLTQRERFWSAVAAANIAGGLIAKRLGLIDWDMKRIYLWTTQMIQTLRQDTSTQADDPLAVLGSYINRYLQNALIVNGNTNGRKDELTFPIMEPRGELLIRYEPDTKKLFLTAKPFKDFCTQAQVSYKDTVKGLELAGLMRGYATKRLGKGMKIASAPVHCLEFDTSSADFIDVDTIVAESENADAGGGS